MHQIADGLLDALRLLYEILLVLVVYLIVVLIGNLLEQKCEVPLCDTLHDDLQ